MNTCPNCGKVAGLHSSILQGCMCQYSMQVPVAQPASEEDMKIYKTIAANYHKDLSTPPQRTWVGLTDEDIHNTVGYNETREMYQFALALIAKLKEKNSA